MQPVSSVVEQIAAPWGVQPAWVQDTATWPHEAMELRLNSQKAHRKLAWSGRLSLATALAWTSTWFRGHLAGDDARGLCESQIDAYLNLEAP